MLVAAPADLERADRGGPTRPARILIAAGGTGGHVYPALALAQTLVARGHPRSSVRFIGSRRGIGGAAVRAAGFEIDLLPGRGLQRSLTFANVAIAVENAAAFLRALRLVARMRPDVTVGFGGYASLPALVAARVLRRRALVHEQNASPGLANRIATRLGAGAAISLPGTPLRAATLTGNPVRPDLVDIEPEPADPPRVVLVGGSLGARTINDVALGLYEAWRERDDVVVHHVSGPADHERCATELAAMRRKGDRIAFTLVDYEQDMAEVYRRASIVVARAGATTVAELAAIGVPSLLVPLPGAPGDHQRRNAQTLVDAGGAIVVDDERADVSVVARALAPILSDAARRRAMAVAARATGVRDAADRLADLVEGSIDG